MTVAQGLLGFHVELTDKAEPVTAYAALPLVVETLRACIAVARYRQLRDALGYRSWRAVRRHVESLLLLFASGGEHMSDLEVLRADKGLEVMLGGRLSSPSQVKARRRPKDRALPVPPACRRSVARRGGRRRAFRGRQGADPSGGPRPCRPGGPGRRRGAGAAGRALRDHRHPDVDATLIASRKAEALRCYEGYRAE